MDLYELSLLFCVSLEELSMSISVSNSQIQENVVSLYHSGFSLIIIIIITTTKVTLPHFLVKQPHFVRHTIPIKNTDLFSTRF